MSSIKIRVKRIEEVTRVRMLIAHPMETGRNLDKATKTVIPAHFIQNVVVTHNDRIIANCLLGTGVSKDPYFSFHIKGGNSGDRINISWFDNLGQSDSAETIIK